MTKNPPDFLERHQQYPDHAGPLLVYRDNDCTRDMDDRAIVLAIGKLLASGLPIAGQVHTLNQWR